MAVSFAFIIVDMVNHLIGPSFLRALGSLDPLVARAACSVLGFIDRSYTWYILSSLILYPIYIVDHINIHKEFPHIPITNTTKESSPTVSAKINQFYHHTAITFDIVYILESFLLFLE